MPRAITEKLRKTSIKKLDAARVGDGLLVSAISVWEIGALERPRKNSTIDTACATGPKEHLGVPGLRFAPLDAAAAAESTLLPGDLHGDPADRFLIATART